MSRPAPIDDRSNLVAFWLIVTLSALALSLLAGATWADTRQPWRTYYEIRLEADGNKASDCKVGVEVSLNPIDVKPPPPGSAYVRESIVDHPTISGKPVQDGPKNWECWYSYRSPLLAPGKWEISVAFNTATQTCVRDVAPGKPNRVRVDEEDGCVEF
ncbi:MAG: hypothetical protein R3E72_02955 [Steroidobacteraceae bacterium]